MKEKLVGKELGFSTIEISIAIAIISIALSGSINANFSGQYWRQISVTKTNASNINNEQTEKSIKLFDIDFYKNNEYNDTNCDPTSFCYQTKTKVLSVSTCANKTEIVTEWKINNYPTSTIDKDINVYNENEIINLGGDCSLKIPNGNWDKYIDTSGLHENIEAKNFTSFDVLNDYIYTTSNSVPTIKIYKISDEISPTLVSSFDIKINGISVRANDIDVIIEIATGRKYAFVAVGGTTNQLAVVDITDPITPLLKSQKNLNNVSPTGSFPQGYRLFSYGNRLYITTRETAGFEFHIFNISAPEFPTEIGNGFELNRTVNEIYVREQIQNNSARKYVFLASDSNLKEFGILEVTNDVVIEVNSINLLGNQDGLSLYPALDKLYFGRANNTSGPELYVFDTSNVTIPITTLAQGETGSNISTIFKSGQYLYLGTNKNSENFQVWTTDFSEWNGSILNSGRKNYFNFPSLSSLGIEVSEDKIVLINSSNIVDRIQTIKSHE